MRSTVHSVLGLLVLAAALGGCESSGSSDSARMRLLNVSTGYESLDVYVDDDNDDDDDERLVLEAVPYEIVSDYVELDSGTYTLEFKRNGVSGTLQTLGAQNLTDDTHSVYVAYGSSGNFAVAAIGEDIDEPDAGDTYVQVFNVTEGAGALDIYFTEASVSLDNVSPHFADAGSGSSTIDSGTYRLRVTGANDTDDLRLDIPEITLESEQVVSLIFTGTQGGVLVDALLLVQQGGLTEYKNTKARVRGAVGISNGTMVTARIAGTTLLTNATAGAIGSTYMQVDAGPAAVSVSVDGADVAVPNQTLEAGADYTLLTWSDASGTQTTLISDDNRLPTDSGEAKIRLLNGMSGFGDPISLAIDYSPLAEGIPLGQASSFTEIDGFSDYQLDVTSTNTTVNLLSRSSVTLQSGAVYTMFMAGGASSDEVSGTLRKDR